MTWTRSNSVGVRWGAAGVAAAAAVATGLGGMTAASAATAVSIPVPCSVTALNTAISLSPSNTILVLKPGCIYSTSSPLKNVTRNLTISGSNDTIRLTGAGTILHVLGASLSISRLTFTGGDGSGPEPGAIHNVGGTLTLANTTFRDNAGGYGGAIQNSSSGSLTISDSSFAYNDASTAGGGGAIADLNSSTLSVSSTNFYDNEGGNGGAIDNYSGTATFTSTSSAAQPEFRGNDADGTSILAGYGGAIYNRSGQVSVDDYTFADNDANKDGGAFRNTGGNSSVSDSGFSSNFSDANGGAVSTTRSLNLASDNITGNTAENNGGGLYVSGGTTTLSQNTLVVANFAAGTGGGIYRKSGTVSLTTGSTVHLNIPNNCTGLFCP